MHTTTIFMEAIVAEQMLKECRSSAFQFERALSLLDSGVDLNYQNKEGVTFLMALSEQSGSAYIKGMRFLLEQGVDINEQDAQGDTALIRACLRGDDRSVKLLLDFKAQPNLKGRQGLTPLAAAATQYDTASILLLLEAGANADVQAVDKRPLLVSLAVSGQGAELISILAFFGAPLDVSDSAGWTPLTQAARSGHLTVASELVKAGVNIDMPGPMYKKALEIALGARAPEAYFGKSHITVSQFEIALLLLKSMEGQPHSLDSLGLPPLIRLWRSVGRCMNEWLNALVEVGCDPFQCDSDGDSLWHWAAEGREDQAILLVKWLISQIETGRRTQHPNIKGVWPEERAIAQGCFQLALLLQSLREKEELESHLSCDALSKGHKSL